jgi:hypothetical protein
LIHFFKNAAGDQVAETKERTVRGNPDKFFGEKQVLGATLTVSFILNGV